MIKISKAEQEMFFVLFWVFFIRQNLALRLRKW